MKKQIKAMRMRPARPVFGLMIAYRGYRCTACGARQQISTNHTDKCYSYCPACSWRALQYHGVRMFNAWHRVFECVDPGDMTRNTYHLRETDK